MTEPTAVIRTEALTKVYPGDIRAMNLAAIYGALIGYTCLLTWAGINGFRRRVLT